MFRRFLKFALVAVVLTVGAGVSMPAAQAYAVSVDLSPFATELSRPLDLTNAPISDQAALLRLAEAAPASIVAAGPSTTVDVGAIATDAEPTILAVLSVVIGAIVALIGWEAKKLLGITVNAKMTMLLHDALMRAATAGVNAAVTKADGVQVDVHSQAVASVITYARTYRADLVKKLGLTDEKLAGLARSTVNQILPAGAQVQA